MRRWIVLREGSRLRWGGDLRRRYVYDGIASLPGAIVQEDWRVGSLRRTLAASSSRWLPWRRAYLASTETLVDEQIVAVTPWVVPAVVDIHDEPVIHAGALGIPLSPSDREAMRLRLRRNLDLFQLWTVLSAALAALIGLDRDRVVVAPNGTRTDVVEPAPWPPEPAVGFVSGAAPNRGIEVLIAAVRLVREMIPETRLHLWLAATGERSASYLDDLRASLSRDPLTHIGSVHYSELGQALGQVWAFVIPTPAHPYWETVAPIKLFDAMAAGRPIVATPRRETASVVDGAGAGLVAAGDEPGDLASAILALLRDPDGARRMGEAARRAAVARHDWRSIAANVATAVLDRLATKHRAHWHRLLPRRT